MLSRLGMDVHSPQVQQVRRSVDDLVANKPHLQFFCSNVCIVRYLSAVGAEAGQNELKDRTDLQVKRASHLLQHTLQWYAHYDSKDA